MNWIELEKAIEEIDEHLAFIKHEINQARKDKIEAMRGYYNGSYSNAGDNGNFDVAAKLANDINKWNEAIRRDP